MQAFNGAADTNRDSFIDTQELRRYLRETVASWSGDQQHPTVDRDNIFQTVKLPVLRKRP